MVEEGEETSFVLGLRVRGGLLPTRSALSVSCPKISELGLLGFEVDPAIKHAFPEHGMQSRRGV